MSDKDYYVLLGVERSATKDDIKKAFHRLARKYHPDNKTTGDEKKFKEINEAYQTLSDEKKRSEYDTYGHVFSGAGGGGRGGFNPFEGFSGFSGQDAAGGVEFDFGDIFSDFFGGGRGQARRGRDISIDLEVPFAESIYGTERTMLVTKTSKCDVCHGSGEKPGAGSVKCGTCNGQGRVRESRSSFLGTFTNVRECGECRGSGKIPKEKCTTCRGLGVARKQEEIVITIPPGINNGEMIRLSQMGEAVSSGIAGDLYVKIHIAPHATFRREGRNLIMDLDIKLTDALLGAEYTIRLLDTSTITLKIPQGISVGEVLRVRGKGIPIDRSRKGDLLVKLNIKLPKNLSSEAEKLFKKLKEEGI